MVDCDDRWEWRMHALSHTQALGERLGRAAQPGDVLLLQGQLGAGKTALTQGIARGLSIGGPVNSPTFTLLKEHRDGRIPLYHFDLYRIDSVVELAELGFDDYIGGDGLAVVEWADRIAATAWDLSHLTLALTVLGPRSRLIAACAQGARAVAWVQTCKG